MNNTTKYMLFRPSDSLYNQCFKFHRIDENTVLISLMANSDSIGYTEKLFPGDDRDQIIVKTRTEKYFRVPSKELEEKLKDVITTNKSIVFIYENTQDVNTLKLMDFYFYEDEDKSDTRDIEKFPTKIIIERDSIFNFMDEDLDWDQMW